MARLAKKTHKDRVHEFNSKLESLRCIFKYFFHSGATSDIRRLIVSTTIFQK